MQGIYVNGVRPKSKKAIKEQILNDPSLVSLEATSMFGDEYNGALIYAPDGEYTFVGPDPYNKRSFYGQIVVKAGTFKVK